MGPGRDPGTTLSIQALRSRWKSKKRSQEDQEEENELG